MNYNHCPGQIIATSAEVTLNCGLVGESPQNPFNSGLGIILYNLSRLSLTYITVDSHEKLELRMKGFLLPDQRVVGHIGMRVFGALRIIIFYSRWWFQTCFIFTPSWGMIQFDEHIFEMSWFNHHQVGYPMTGKFRSQRKHLNFHPIIVSLGQSFWIGGIWRVKSTLPRWAKS